MAESYPGYQAGVGGAKPSNNIVWSVIALVVALTCTGGCGLIAAIPSLIFALQVDNKWNMGDYAGAEDSARKAKLWGMIGVIGSVVLGAIFIILYIVLIAAAVTTTNITVTTFR